MNDSQSNPMPSGARQGPNDPSTGGNSTPESGHASEATPVEEAIRAAGDDVRKAAEAVCRDFQEEAARQVKRLRETTVGDLVDGALNLFKKYPGPGVIVAVLIGFFLGRSLRK